MSKRWIFPQSHCQDSTRPRSKLEAAATGIAGAAESPSSTVDLSAEVVALLSDTSESSLDVATLKVADQTEKNAVDAFA